MAFKRRGFKSKRRGARRGGLRRRAGTKYLRGGSGLVKATKTLGRPDRMIVKLPYYEQFSLQNAVSPGANYFWNMNSIWDPNRSGIGHNPSYFTSWAAIYNRYRVMGVKARVTFAYGAEGGSAWGNRVYLYGSNDTVQTGDDSQMEQAHMTSSIIHPNGKPVTTLTKYFNCPRITGRTLQQYLSDDRYQATMRTNPQEVLAITAGVRNLAPGATNSGLVSCTIHLTYYVELFDPILSPLQDEDPASRVPALNVQEEVNKEVTTLVAGDVISVKINDPVV